MGLQIVYIYIYIYIYIKSETLYRQHKVLPCNALFKKIIETLLNHIKDKNKLKNRDSLFPLIQCFKIFHLSQKHKTLHFHSQFSLLLLYILYSQLFMHLISNTPKPKTIIYLQPFNVTNITLTLSYHLILTCMCRLCPRKGACIFY